MTAADENARALEEALTRPEEVTEEGGPVPEGKRFENALATGKLCAATEAGTSRLNEDLAAVSAKAGERTMPVAGTEKMKREARLLGAAQLGTAASPEASDWLADCVGAPLGTAWQAATERQRVARHPTIPGCREA